jgi:hypothetical protein
MTAPHRATPDEWEAVQLHANPDAYCFRDSCILELHYRVEALEAAQDADHFRGVTKMVTAPEAAPVATDDELCRAWHSAPDFELSPALRMVYDLGRKHGAQSTPPPAPTPAPSTQRAQRLLDELEKGGLPAVLRHLAAAWGVWVGLDHRYVSSELLEQMAAALQCRKVGR